jgi:hypothetical protein
MTITFEEFEELPKLDADKKIYKLVNNITFKIQQED